LEKEKIRERHPERRREGENYISRSFDETCLAHWRRFTKTVFVLLLNRLKNIIFCLSIKDKTKTVAKQLVFSLL
jgi:hypothetical protein